MGGCGRGWVTVGRQVYFAGKEEAIGGLEQKNDDIELALVSLIC